jgi:nicotinate-nucleotide adenylyltransferase
MRIALFGMSADPPTAGHQSILCWLAQHFDQVAVWASDNPFKSHQTPLLHRMAMLSLLIRDLPVPAGKITLEPEFSDRKSLISLQKARSRWGESADYSLVIGSDLVEQIQSWYRATDLFQLTHILVIPRPHYPISPPTLAHLKKLGAQCQVADLEAPAVSSTDYRQTRDEEVIPAPVQAYIQQEHLYS